MRLFLFLSLLLSSQAAAGGSDELRADLVHADLSFYTEDWEVMWPRAFVSDDGLGCVSRVSFGDWKLAHSGEMEEPHWFRMTNYGAFHCYLMVRDAVRREQLTAAAFDYGHFVRIGTAGPRADSLELWAIQRGGRPGSDYILLARKPGPGLIEQFTVLQRACPSEWIRDAGNIDILSTRYCAVPSREDLVAFARRMAKRPPLGTLSLAGEAYTEGEDKGSD